MKTVLFILIGASLLAQCQTDAFIPSGSYPVWQNSVVPAQLLTITEAEKILGAPAHLSDSASQVVNGVGQYRCTYTAHATEPTTGKTGNIYFLFEQYPDAFLAGTTYRSIAESNQDHQGFQTLPNLGDEAYFHSDNENFCFILARKGNYMIRMKVNKLTTKTSIPEFNKAAEKIMEGL